VLDELLPILADGVAAKIASETDPAKHAKILALNMEIPHLPRMVAGVGRVRSDFELPTELLRRRTRTLGHDPFGYGNPRCGAISALAYEWKSLVHTEAV